MAGRHWIVSIVPSGRNLLPPYHLSSPIDMDFPQLGGHLEPMTTLHMLGKENLKNNDISSCSIDFLKKIKSLLAYGLTPLHRHVIPDYPY
jgi:hypothetical protein